MSAHASIGLLFVLISVGGFLEHWRQRTAPVPFAVATAAFLVMVVNLVDEHASHPADGARFGHAFIGGVIFVSWLLSAVGRRRSIEGLELMPGMGLFVAASLFAVRESSDASHLAIHAIVATTLALAGLIRLSVVIARDEARALQVLGLLLVFLGGLGLLLYDSPFVLGGPHSDH